jgi:hypothetical protein
MLGTACRQSFPKVLAGFDEALDEFVRHVERSFHGSIQKRRK